MKGNRESPLGVDRGRAPAPIFSVAQWDGALCREGESRANTFRGL